MPGPERTTERRRRGREQQVQAGRAGRTRSRRTPAKMRTEDDLALRADVEQAGAEADAQAETGEDQRRRDGQRLGERADRAAERPRRAGRRPPRGTAPRRRSETASHAAPRRSRSGGRRSSPRRPGTSASAAAMSSPPTSSARTTREHRDEPAAREHLVQDRRRRRAPPRLGDAGRPGGGTGASAAGRRLAAHSSSWGCCRRVGRCVRPRGRPRRARVVLGGLRTASSSGTPAIIRPSTSRSVPAGHDRRRSGRGTSRAMRSASASTSSSSVDTMITGVPLSRSCDDPLVHELDRADVEAARRLRRDEQRAAAATSRGPGRPSAGCRRTACSRARRSTAVRTSNSSIALLGVLGTAAGCSATPRANGAAGAGRG